MSPLSFIIIIVALTTLARFKESLKTYSVRKATRTPVLSGKGDDPQWQQAVILSDFQYPWEKEKAPPTRFRALHDDAWLYCLFDVTDHAVYLQQETNHKTEVASSSRAEIFFKADDKLDPYYCLEIDPLGRVLDYEATYHRKFNSNWSWPEGHLTIKTERRKDGYTVEAAISKESLRKLGLLKNHTLQAGIFRANCRRNANGQLEFKWISWVKPDSKTPDFHIPSSFGLLELEH